MKKASSTQKISSALKRTTTRDAATTPGKKAKAVAPSGAVKRASAGTKSKSASATKSKSTAGRARGETEAYGVNHLGGIQLGEREKPGRRTKNGHPSSNGKTPGGETTKGTKGKPITDAARETAPKKNAQQPSASAKQIQSQSTH